jgi:hypothetical protein
VRQIVNAFLSAIDADGIHDTMVVAAPVLMEYPALAEDFAEDDEEVDTLEVVIGVGGTTGEIQRRGRSPWALIP